MDRVHKEFVIIPIVVVVDAHHSGYCRRRCNGDSSNGELSEHCALMRGWGNSRANKIETFLMCYLKLFFFLNT